MKKQMLLGMFAFALMICLVAGPAQAQDMGKISLFGGYSYQLNNLGESSCFFSDFCGGGQFGMHGYTVAGTYNFNKNIGIEANLAGHNGGAILFSEAPTTNNNGFQEQQTQDIYTYTFGPKVTLPVGNFSLFSHFLVGAMHAHLIDNETCTNSTGGETTCSVNNTFSTRASGNGMAFKTGAGADWNHGRWGIRILEVDYVHGSISATGSVSCSGCSPSETARASANNFELSTGFLFNF